MQALRTIVICVGAVVLQFFSMFVVGVVGLLLEMTSSGALVAISGRSNANTLATADVVGLLISAIVMLAIYAGVWYVFWVMNVGEDGQIPQFGWKLLCAGAPIVAALAVWRPIGMDSQPGMSIVYAPATYIFGLLVAALVLFPMYAFGLKRYVFPNLINGSFIRRMSALLGVLLVVGTVLYFGATELFPHLYKA